MSRDRLHERITDQFSYRGEHADVWRGFDRILETDEFLNLGYSRRYQPHVLGSPQLRLAREVGSVLASRLPSTSGVPLLDVGCGRGGPSTALAERFGFDVTGVDLVPYNVATARKNADRRGASAHGRNADGRGGSARFLAGDAGHLPFAADSFAACTAIDSVVYVPEKERVFGNVARALRPGGSVVVSDLLVRDDAGPSGREAVAAFADSWDMPPLASVDRYRTAMERAGLTVDRVRDVTSNSIGRFRKWARLYLGLADRAGRGLERVLRRWDLDAAAVTEQVRAAGAALPHLTHVIVTARS